MSEDPRAAERSLLRRVSVIVRSWDGPNSRIGLEMDLTQMPWGPFDALGKRLNLLVPAPPGGEAPRPAPESQIERALRHVEHAADRCGEFSRLANGNQELWLRSQETWEWIRRYLTAHWVDLDVDARPNGAPVGESLPLGALAMGAGAEPVPPDAPGPGPGPAVAPLPSLPGAASTLQAVARALRATPLSVWRESMGATDEDSPTREEAIQTLLAVARILGAGEGGGREAPPPPEPRPEPTAKPAEDPDPDQVSFDFASGYDEGYRMGRRVGLALGAQKGARQGKG